MKKNSKSNLLIKAAVSITIALALVMPGVAVFTETDSEKSSSFTLSENQQAVEIALFEKQVMSKNMRLSDELVFPTVGDDSIPGITKDDNGYTVLTYTNWEDPTISNMAIWFSDTPLDPASWTGWVISLSGMDIMNYIDTARVAGPDPDDWRGLFGTFISEDMEATGGYQINDITSDPSEWMYYTWTGGAPEVSYACVDDNSWFEDLYYPDVIGPAHMYIYRMIYDVYDIPDCPILFHTGIASESGVSFFDGQSELHTAPASDPDMANLDEKLHLTWQYHNETTDIDQIVWKMIVPSVEPDIEYTPYQQYIGDGTHSSVGASGDNVAVIYEDGPNITVAYSDNNGDSWSSVVLAEGTFPDIEAVADIFYATYIVEGDLFLVTSADNGATWSDPIQLNSIIGSVEEEENSVDIHAGGIAWVDNSGADFDIVWIKLPTESPSPPHIDGPSQVKVNEEATFTVSSGFDPQDDMVSYYVDWGDGTNSGWTEYVNSGEPVVLTNSWDEQKDFKIQAKAKDENGHESEWGPPHQLTVPRSIEINNSLFLRILQNFPMLFKLLQNLNLLG